MEQHILSYNEVHLDLHLMNDDGNEYKTIMPCSSSSSPKEDFTLEELRLELSPGRQYKCCKALVLFFLPLIFFNIPFSPLPIARLWEKVHT